MKKNRFKIALLVTFSLFITSTFSQEIDANMLAKAKLMGISEAQIREQMAKQQGTPVAKPRVVKPADNQYSLRGDKLSEEENEKKQSRVVPQIPTSQSDIYGQSMFKNSDVTYEPNLNIPTPIDYVLSIGDEIIINVWGDSESIIKETISPEGLIYIANLGPIHINGMTAPQAQSYIKKQFSKIDESIGSTSQITLSIGEIRSIKVNITGEVSAPGIYTVPSLATLFHVLHISGGTTDLGDLRNIEVFRDSKKIADMDIYSYIMNGDISNNIILQDGDVIVVPTYSVKAQVIGAIKRPMFYLMKDSETVSNLLQYAGGFSGDAYKTRVKLFRKSGEYNEIIIVDKDDFDKTILNNGDRIFVEKAKDEFDNLVQIKGAVWYPGDFELNENTNLLSKLIEYSGGLRGHSFSKSAMIERLNSDYTDSIINFNPAEIVSGKRDITIKNYDKIFIPELDLLQEVLTVRIEGEVNSPKTIRYREGMRIEDAILLSGGLKEAASLSIIDVSRRLNNSESIEYTEKKSELFSFKINEDLTLTPETKEFILSPYDIVVVRRSPQYKIQATISIYGEVLVPGIYTIEYEKTYLSDVINMAKGTTPLSHIKGSSLMRRFDDNSIKLSVDKLQRSVLSPGDSLSINGSDLALLPVAINLDKALAEPYGSDDILLKQGDVIVIPKFENIVRTIGAVYSENSVTYKGRRLKKYIESSGGYTKMARKRPFVLYQNGTIKATKRFFFVKIRPRVEPGCVVVVPMKSAKDKMSLLETLGIVSSATSLTSSLATLGLNIAATSK